MFNPRNLSAALLNAISPPSLTSYPSNNINEGPGTHYPDYPSGDGHNLRPPCTTAHSAFQAAGINAIHRLGQKANQTYVQQIRVCVFSCYHNCAGLLESLMRSLVKSWGCRKRNALKCMCHLKSAPPTHFPWDIYDELTLVIKIPQKCSHIMLLSFCCQRRMAAGDWLGWKVERGPVLKMALYPLKRDFCCLFV